ncbi:MAG: hypothetical protein ACXWXQ_00215, partial [Actinomycetota bacterium]
MLRKKVLVALVALVVFVMGSGTAQAWDLIADRSGHGRVTLRAWTRNYNQVAFVANHSGTRVSVAIEVNCRNGDQFENTWSDGGGRFRYTLGGLGNSGRCNHTFRVVANDSFPDLYLAVAARG